MISYEDFLKVVIRVGTVIEAEVFTQARKPAYKLTIDFGPLGFKKSSAQITKRYPDPKELIGKQVLAVVNFPPKQIGPFISEVLTLGLENEEAAVVLAGPGDKIPNGNRLF